MTPEGQLVPTIRDSSLFSSIKLASLVVFNHSWLFLFFGSKILCAKILSVKFVLSLFYVIVKTFYLIVFTAMYQIRI